uniref:Centromere protein O n=1 Tax=Calidris pygmaea TaxID=425635 RepID=A0A8C3J7J2_9CHAR
IITAWIFERVVLFLAGVFAHLELLEARAYEAAVKQEETEQQEEKLARLRARVQQLRLQRDELRAKLDLQEKGVRKGWLQTSGSELWCAPALRGGKLTKRGVCFCISTAYEGTYLDSYHLDLLTKPEVQIYRHSLPTFIPLQQIAKKYLQTDIRRFLTVLSDHLNAYVGRRYQADQLQVPVAAIEGTLQRNSLCNLLVFNYNVSSKSKAFPFHARLLYGDLCCSLPTEVVVSCTRKRTMWGSVWAEMAAAHTDLFRHVALHKAFSSFSSVGESLAGAL